MDYNAITNAPSNEYETEDKCSHVVTDPNGIPSVLKQDADWLVTLIPSDSSAGNPIAPDGGYEWADESRDLFDFESAYEYATTLARSSRIDTDSGDKVALAYRFTAEGPYTAITVREGKQSVSTPVRYLSEAICPAYVEGAISGDAVNHILRAHTETQIDGGQPISDVGSATVTVRDRDHYVTFTGDSNNIPVVPGYGQATVDGILAWIRSSEESREHTPTTSIWAQKERVRSRGHALDLPQRAYAPRAIRTAKRYDQRFKYLFEGHHSEYRMQSSVDMALAKKLAFWCRGDLALMDECFKRSERYGRLSEDALVLKSYDSNSYESYCESTLKRARQNTTERYSGAYLEPQ